MCNCGKNKVVQQQQPPVPNFRNRAVAAPPPSPSPFQIRLAAPAPAELQTVDTSVWGAPLWMVLHTAAQFSTARENSSMWSTIISALKTGLPCPDCSAHFNAWAINNRLRMTIIKNGSHSPIVSWILNLHNAVNRRNGGTAWTIDRVRSTYGYGNKADRVAEATAALQTLQGIIGDSLFNALSALLQSFFLGP